MQVGETAVVQDGSDGVGDRACVGHWQGGKLEQFSIPS